MGSGPFVPVFMLHKVGVTPKGAMFPAHYVSPALFGRQMRLLRTLGYQTVSFDDLFSERQPKKAMVVSFDDGYRNYAEHAHPVLRELGFGATVFLVSGQFGGTNAWDVKLGDQPEPLLSVDEIRRLSREGVEFGSHTVDHVDLSTVGVDVAERQIRESKAAIEAVVGKPISCLCYPYGNSGEAVQLLTSEAGYRWGCTVRGGFNTPSTPAFGLRRTNLRSDTTVPVLLIKLLRDRLKARHG